MKKWLKSVFSKKSVETSARKEQVAARNTDTGMFRVIESIDKQIGRAVTRLSDR